MLAGDTFLVPDVAEVGTADVATGVETIHVTFYVPVTPELAERKCLANSSLHRGMKSLVGAAWDGIGVADGDEDEIDFPDGSSTLILDDKGTGKIVTSKIYANGK